MDYMMWYSGENVPVADRIARAATFYEGKHGRKPTLCLIPKSEGTVGPVDGISCRAESFVLPAHLWLGEA
jgi:hypothetical protein